MRRTLLPPGETRRGWTRRAVREGHPDGRGRHHSAVKAARRLVDPVGRYNRPDMFQLFIDARTQRAVRIVAHEFDPRE